MVAVDPAVMASRSGSRRYYFVPEGAARPRFDPTLSVRDNAVRIAAWEWGGRRADRAAELADEIVDVDGDAALWTAAVLCAVAAEGGREQARGWSRTLTALSEMTGVPREEMVARRALLQPLRPTA